MDESCSAIVIAAHKYVCDVHTLRVFGIGCGGAGGHRCFAVYLRSPRWQQWADSREGPHISRYQNLFGVRLRCEKGTLGKHQREAGVWTAGAERHSGKRGTGVAWAPGRGRPSWLAGCAQAESSVHSDSLPNAIMGQLCSLKFPC